MDNKITEIVATIICFILLIICVIFLFWGVTDERIKSSGDILICKNVQKFYKDDILFDNFYISCDNRTIQVDVYQYTRIVENGDYKITLNAVDNVDSLERIDEK